jgi:hypothetical protein
VSFFGFGKKKNAPAQPLAPDPKMARRMAVGSCLLRRAYDVAENCEGICDNPVFRQHAIALGHTIAAAVTAICFTEMRYFNAPPFYSDIWTRSENCFDDLASFLSYWFVCHEMLPGDPDRAVLTPELLSVAATVYTASNRAHRMIDRYDGLMRDPSELRDRRILMLSDRCDDDEVLGTVFAFVVNETIGGPPLEGDVNDETSKGVAIDPCYARWLRWWMDTLQIGLIQVYREGVQVGRDVPLGAYVAATDFAFSEAEDMVMKVFG